MSYEFAKKEIGDYRITIYQDDDAECPCSAWDLAGVYFWDYSNYISTTNLLMKSMKRMVDIISTSTSQTGRVISLPITKKHYEYDRERKNCRCYRMARELQTWRQRGNVRDKRKACMGWDTTQEQCRLILPRKHWYLDTSILRGKALV